MAAAPAKFGSDEALASLMKRLATSDATAPNDVAALVAEKGIGSLKQGGLLEQLKAAAGDMASAEAREGALSALTALAQTIGTPFEPYLVHLLPLILERMADKVPAVRSAAVDASRALGALLCPHAVKLVLPGIFEGLDSKRTWQTKTGALGLLGELTKRAPEQVGSCLEDIIPALTVVMGDAKPQVKKAAIATMTQVCNVIGNRDILPFVPAMVSCVATPAEVPACVHKLAATTFVQQVEAPTLAITVPLLLRGLRERQTAVKRKTVLIVDNMAKLVDDPNDAALFLPRLLPGVQRVADEVADPECRSVATKAVATLQRIASEIDTTPKKAADVAAVLKSLEDILAKSSHQVIDPFTEEALSYVAQLACVLIDAKKFDFEDWSAHVVTPYMSSFLAKQHAEEVCQQFLDACYESTLEKKHADDDEEEGEDLCNCEFSLAYGAKILLNNTRLHLKRGHRYGLCGANGTGKSTLMRAIANGQLDGFPPPEVLRTIFVEHDIQADQADYSCLEFIMSFPALKDVPKEEIVKTLSSVGFSDEMQNGPVTALSGGWKMKLALARAILMNADILLLDEPTNHLDVTNVKWLEDYLNSQTNVSSMIVSHDSGFLDHVCTDIIHYENRKLKKYRGNLSKFVENHPEAKSYYALEAATTKFAFPEPGFLEGIKSKGKAILSMTHCDFTYPGASKQTLFDISVQCSLSSRVAVTGRNGAGKSTVIKLLTGEMEPNTGAVWKHPNLRVAYVAQHAFHHVEQHLDKTPNEYIRWRYASGEDREEQSKVSRQVTKEEEEQMAQKVMAPDGTKKVVESLLGRRKLKRGYEYEVQWVGFPIDQTSWLTRDDLEQLGFTKMVNEIDAKEAANAGLYSKPLTVAVVQKHLEDVGLEAEFGTHAHIRGLSGGQKVKVVIGAAMWNNPHMLILDEPTNYLDRESLGALAGAIKAYGGGVVIISHNREFCDALCEERWAVEDGHLTASGQAWNVKEKLEWKREEETTDAFGNTIKIKEAKKKLSRQEMKKRAKDKKARRDRGEEVSDDEE